MTPQERNAIARRLRPVLMTMSIPSFRVQFLGESNLQWIKAHLAATNLEHERRAEVLETIEVLLGSKN